MATVFTVLYRTFANARPIHTCFQNRATLLQRHFADVPNKEMSPPIASTSYGHSEELLLRPRINIGRHPHLSSACSCKSGRQWRTKRRQAFKATATAVTDAVKSGKEKGHPKPGVQLQKWLKEQGAPEQLVKVQETEVLGNHLDVTVASRALKPGDTALRIPENLVITLSRVFQDDTVAELLTSGKLSELACLTLYLMYEKKNGKDSFWYQYIRELDRVRGRGLMGARTPLLWDKGQVEDLLQGSPIVHEVHQRIKGIEREYQELDTVWFMAGSLFQNYPYDIPTEAFSMELFKQAFAAVQASVVHLQGVPLAQRFALVPLGPPLLSYSSTSKAMLRYEPSTREVQLTVDRAYKEGEPINAWFGPQPNNRAFLNYGIVDENNPHDKMALQVTIPQADPLFQLKRSLLQQYNLATQQTFQLQRHQDLPEYLIPYMRFAHCIDEDSVRRAADFSSGPVSPDIELTALQQLSGYLQGRLRRYKTTREQDDATIADPSTSPRAKVAARLLRIEKSILGGAVEKIMALPGAEGNLEGIGQPHVVSVRLGDPVSA